MNEKIKEKFINSYYLFALACHEQDEVYPNEPRIEFLDIAFQESSHEGSFIRDSLKLTIQLTDGDLDFGLESTDVDFPYQPNGK